jgi:hypothetical protein
MTGDRTPGEEGVVPQDRTEAPREKPEGALGGDPVNADETAPRDAMPEPSEGGSPGERHPEAVDDEPGSDL